MYQTTLRTRNLSDDVFDLIKREKEEMSLWMNLINSNDLVSDSVIVENFKLIDWKKLSRPLSESAIRRFKTRMLNWNEQLAIPRTFEFLIEFQDKFDWNKLSKELPTWFNDIYLQQFIENLNWDYLTLFISRMNDTTICLAADKFDWGWITKKYIPSEVFAYRYMKYIHWDDPELMVDNLDTEFIYDINSIRQVGSECGEYQIIPYITKYKKLQVLINGDLAKSFEGSLPIIFGKAVGKKFLRDHKNKLNVVDLLQRGLITDDNIDYEDFETTEMTS